MSARRSHILFASVAIVLSLALSLIPQSTYALDLSLDVYPYAYTQGGVFYYCSDSITVSPYTQSGHCGSGSPLQYKYWLKSGENRLENTSNYSNIDGISGIQWTVGARDIPAYTITAIPFYLNIGAQAMNFDGIFSVLSEDGGKQRGNTD